jgi:hypothetical protein
MVKNAIEHGRQSMSPDGLTMARFPTGVHQFTPSFSLWWIGIGYDYWMYRGDEDYMKTLLPAYRSVLSWFEQYLNPDYSLGAIPDWFFVDWAEEYDNAQPPRGKDGNSALQDLMFIIALDYVSQMEKSFGLPVLGDYYKSIADAMRHTFRSKYYNSDKNLFADTPEKTSFSQHANSLAVLANVVSGEEAKNIMTTTLNDKRLIQATIFFKYYVHQALHKVGLGDLLLDNLQIWKDQMALGLTTWAERPEPSRSDCHAWGSSPNIEFYRIILGINTSAPGFRKVIISPSLRGVKKISGSMPHPSGEISVSYMLRKDDTLEAIISIPDSIEGLFVWKDKHYPLHGGSQTLSIKP